VNTYTVTNTEKWGLREYSDLSHSDYEHNILITRCYKWGEFEITPRNAKEEEKLLNWPVGEDFILDHWDWDVVEFFDSDLDADSEMDHDELEAIEEETNYFWDLVSGDTDWNEDDNETIIVDGEFNITAPKGWEIVDA